MARPLGLATTLGPKISFSRPANSFLPATATARSSPFAHARSRSVAACTHATPSHLRTSHCVAIAFPTVCMRLALALLHSPPPSPPSVPKLCSAAAIALTASLSPAPPDSHPLALTLTRRAVAARVFAHLFGAERERRPPSLVLFSLPPRRRAVATLDAVPGSLGRSSKARCAEQQRRGAASHLRWPTAVPTESLPSPATILHLAAVFAARPPPASWAGSPRTLVALERPERKTVGYR